MSLLMPFSIAFDASGLAFPNEHIGATNGRKDYGIGINASLSADTPVHLRFQLPPALPSGTPKLLIKALANATTGNAQVNPKWASVAAEENPDTITLNEEGTQTLSWASGDNDAYKEAKVDLDADTLIVGEAVVMEAVFETTDWTLAQISTWNFFIIWE